MNNRWLLYPCIVLLLWLGYEGCNDIRRARDVKDRQYSTELILKNVAESALMYESDEGEFPDEKTLSDYYESKGVRIKINDGYGHPIKCKKVGDGEVETISSGRDGKFDTRDDTFFHLKGSSRKQ